MTPEDLLKPRFKVIADFPDNKLYPVNSIITLDNYVQRIEGDIPCCFIYGGGVKDKNFFNQFPHIFKKLEWWEAREIEDLRTLG